MTLTPPSSSAVHCTLHIHQNDHITTTSFSYSPLRPSFTSELSEPTYGDVKGVEAVRAELEKGLPGKEVCTLIHLHEMWI
jgi:hypothetical protein